MLQSVEIRSIEYLTHNVLRVRVEKPEGMTYKPGQAVNISISKPGWENNVRSLTLTSLPEEDFLEFVVKIIPSIQGTVSQLATADPGDKIFIHEIFGGIHYKGEGIFIAGGSGIAPFIAILKDLERRNIIGNNKLIFANNTKKDIILEEPFRELLGDNFINILSDEKLSDYEHGFINAELIKKHIQDNLEYYYLCGPIPMLDAVEKNLLELGVKKDYIIKQNF